MGLQKSVLILVLVDRCTMFNGGYFISLRFLCADVYYSKTLVCVDPVRGDVVSGWK